MKNNRTLVIRNNRFSIAALLVAHVPLALLIWASWVFATLHALGVLAIGLWWAARGRLDRVACVGAYIAGAEMLWRMCDTAVNWEFGKYSLSLIFLVALLSKNLKFLLVPALYFVLLIPSVGFTLAQVPGNEIRNQISYNLSGPFLLMLSVCFFSQLRISTDQLLRVCLALIYPLVGVATIALVLTITGTSIEFSDQTNTLASGRAPPNQVSAVLGLGALLAVLVMMHDGTRNLRGLFLGILLAFIAQSMVTFSRGGAYLAAGGVLVAFCYVIRTPRARRRLMTMAVVVSALMAVVIFPKLNAFSVGALASRFQSTDTSGRYEILLADIEIWKRNPILGVGPGRATALRAGYYEEIVAHTEFSRMMAEHGLFGLGALLLMGLMAVYSGMRWWKVENWPVGMAWMAWSLMFMAIYGMRLAVPAFLFGLALVKIVSGASAAGAPYAERTRGADRADCCDPLRGRTSEPISKTLPGMP